MKTPPCYHRTLFCLLALCFLISVRSTQADEKGNALLREVIAATKAVPALTLDFTITSENRSLKVLRATGHVLLKRPNFARIEVTAGAKTNVVEDQTLAADGKTLWTYLKDFKRCQRTPVEGDGSNVINWCMPISFFFTPDHLRLYSELFDVSTHDLGTQTVDGETYHVLEIAPDEFDARITTYRIFLGPDRLIRRVTEDFGQRDDRIKIEIVCTRLHVEKTLPDAAFRYQPPRNSRIVDVPVLDYDKSLLRVGGSAPDFHALTPDGLPIDLTGALKGKKALLVTFWFYGCAPCRAEFPTLQALYDAWHDKGLEIVAINNGDDAALVRRYRAQGKFTFPLAIDPNGGKPTSLFADYYGSAFPTAYLLDAQGKILWRSHTFDPAAIRALLEQQGLQ